MSLTRVLGRASRTAVTQCRNSLFLSPPSPTPHHHHLALLSRRLHSISNFSNKASSPYNVLRSFVTFTPRGMSTSASGEQEQVNKGDNGSVDASNRADETASAKSSEQTQESDSEVDLEDLSREDLVKLLIEKEEVLQAKDKKYGDWKNDLLRSYADMENVMQRTRRDAENSKKFAVQSFAKSLLDVADNLSRASSVTKESFGKIDVSQDTGGAVPALKTLLEGVEMTEKQLAEVFRKSGIEKIDPTNEQFDPNRHNAVFQVPDSSKPPGTVAVVLKAGYTLHDRIIRPAEVGVTVALENSEAES